MLNGKNKDKRKDSSPKQPLSLTEKKKLLAKLYKREQDNSNNGKKKNKAPVTSSQENIKDGQSTAGKGGGYDDKFDLYDEERFGNLFTDEEVNERANKNFSYYPNEMPGMSQNGFGGQPGDAQQNPFLDFFQSIFQNPHFSQFFDTNQNPFARPFQNEFTKNPMEMFTEWMQQCQTWLGGTQQNPFTNSTQSNSNGPMKMFSDWTQMFQKAFSEQVMGGKQNSWMNAQHDVTQNPFLSQFTNANQAQSGSFAKNSFLDPKTIFAHWSQQIPWEYFWSEIRKNKIFGISGMVPPTPHGSFSQNGDHKQKKKKGSSSKKYSAASPLIKMKESGSRNPFFCVHALLGSSFHFHFLANQMEKEQPFYALQAPGLGTGAEGTPIDDIEEFASLYVKSIRTVQKKGPYHLGGYSFGGWIAFEMARQLVKEGEEVGLIAVFGASVPFSVLNPSLFEEIRLYDQFMEDYNTTIIHPFLPPEERKPLSYFKDQMNKKLTPLQRVMKAHTQAIISYLPYPCDSKVTLFETLDLQLICPYDYSRGWNRLSSKEVEVHHITGNHLSMLEEPHIKVLGEKLRYCLRKENGID